MVSAPIDSAARRGDPAFGWIRQLARWGYFAKGLIYLLIGYFAGEAAIGHRAQPTDSRGALWTLFNKPSGEFLLIFMAVTLAGFAVWRLIQAVGPVRINGSRLGIGRRLHRFYSALVHGVIAASAARLFLTRNPGPSNERSWEEMTAWALSRPNGRNVIIGIGLLVAGAGVYKFVRACRSVVWSDLRFRDLPPAAQRTIVALGRFGELTRGVLFFAMGGFVVQAAARFDPNRVEGLAGTLQTFRNQMFGDAWLIIIAAGLGAFGLFLILSARYQRL